MLDVKSAYRTVPVHPADRHLLGMSWEGKLFIDTTLLFGLRSAPKIFTGVADALEWVLAQRGVASLLHYLGDFLFIGTPGSRQCSEALDTAIFTCGELGVPLATDKLEGPTTTLTFLGIELDTEKIQLRLLLARLQALKTMIVSWQKRKACSKRDLLSLIGHLQHACKVVKPGRTFLRRMIDLSTTAAKLHRHIRLNLGFRSDL